jgi:hypothetical protein
LLLIRGILAALRQKLHLSTCPNLASHLFLRRREGCHVSKVTPEKFTKRDIGKRGGQPNGNR